MSAWTVPSYAEGWSVPGYVEERQLGAGASGRVMAAVSELTGQRVAIKYLSPALIRDPSFMWGFRTEAQTLRALDVPQVVQLYDYVEEPGQGAAIVMELVDGVSLHEMITQRGPTTPESALVVLKGSLLGLAAAHALGIVHRDYKPENVLVDTQGESKLTDFGVATKSGKKALTAGTPLYMAPEQWNGAPNSPATDVYAATAVFFECLTAETPFTGKLGQLREQHETAAVPTDRIYPPLQGLIARGMAKNPLDRPQSAIAFVAELEATAAAVYGHEWEERGRSQLAERAAALLPLLLLRHGQAGSGGTSAESSWLGGGGGGGSGGGRARRGRGRRRALTVAAVATVAVVAVAAVAAAVTLTGKSHKATLSGTSQVATITPTFSAQATVTPPVTAGTCLTAASFSYKGTITATAAGTVSYQWVYSSGKPGPVQTAHFTAAGHQPVTGAVVKTSEAGTGWGEIKLVGGKVSNKASYKLLCATTAGGISASASVSPPTRHNTCATTTPTFTATGSVTSQKAETVTYYWALSDGVNSAPATLTFTGPGTLAAAPLTITPTADPASGEAVLVVTSPVSAASAPATYALTCTAAVQTLSAAATVNPATQTIASCTATAPTFTFGGSITATAAGAVGYYWKLPSGNGPAQTLSFTGAGTKAVTAASYKPASDTASGSGSIVVTTPHAAASNAAAFKLTCGTGLSLTSSAATTATVGAAYSGTATVTGGQGAYAWSVTGLPAGLTSAATAGSLKISGTPTTAATATVKLTVTDGATPKHTATTSFTLKVSPPKLTLTDSGGTTATVRTAYTATATAAGGTPAYKYTATGLPAGLAVSATTGAVSGTPTAAGTSTITVTVTDSATTAQKATASWTLTVSAPKLTLTSGAATTATLRTAYSASVTAAGGTPAYKYTATGLPAGLAVSATTGAVSGTPTAAGASTITVTVTDSAATPQTASVSWTLTVSAPKLALAGGTLGSGTVGVAYSATVAASGGTPAYTYSGTPPSGLTLTTSGAITGTPKTAAGKFSFTVTVKDAGGQTASATYSITFAQVVIASSSPSPSPTTPVIT
jgi:serine/threonine-protein kinase